MAFNLSFDRFAEYDAGLPGITLDITLKLAEKATELTVKIDTGSTDCIFAREAARRLDLDVESGGRTEFSTATGRFWAFRHEVSLQILGQEFDASVYFAEDESFRRSVLGRHGFLDRTVLGLVDYEGRLYLARYGK